jgi:hypothetical protein
MFEVSHPVSDTNSGDTPTARWAAGGGGVAVAPRWPSPSASAANTVPGIRAQRRRSTRITVERRAGLVTPPGSSRSHGHVAVAAGAAVGDRACWHPSAGARRSRYTRWHRRTTPHRSRIARRCSARWSCTSVGAVGVGGAAAAPGVRAPARPRTRPPCSRCRRRTPRSLPPYCRPCRRSRRQLCRNCSAAPGWMSALASLQSGRTAALGRSRRRRHRRAARPDRRSAGHTVGQLRQKFTDAVVARWRYRWSAACRAGAGAVQHVAALKSKARPVLAPRAGRPAWPPPWSHPVDGAPASRWSTDTTAPRHPAPGPP